MQNIPHKPTVKRIDSFYIYRMDRCQNCGTENLELYDYFNNPMGYKNIVDLYMKDERMPRAFNNKRAFYTIRCKKCGQAYPIIWNGGFPLPDFNPNHIREFMFEFRHLKK